MNLGEKLLELRKSKQLSQEEVADKLNVSRQTISKWETGVSQPDFDKIVPLCELYGISSDELLTGKKNQSIKEDKKIDNEILKRNRAKGISISILFYFLAIIWIMVTIPVFKMNPIIASAGFLLICGVATMVIVYTCIINKPEKPKEENINSIPKQINEVLSIIVLIIYLFVSFITMAWHITWLLWIFYALVREIVKLIFMLKENKDEK